MSILMLAPRASVQGPIPSIANLLAGALAERGCRVAKENWGRHRDEESRIAKVVGRAIDIVTVFRKLRRERADVLYVHTSHGWSSLLRDIPLLIAVRLLCPTIVVQLHGSRPEMLLKDGNLLFKLLSRQLARLADAVLLLSSEESKSWKIFHSSGDYHVVANPFQPLPDHDTSLGAYVWQIPPSMPVILFVGRLIREKGILDLLEAAASMRTRVPFHLLVLGDGPATEEVEKRVAELGLSRMVTLAGYTTGSLKTTAYRSATIFVLPTYWNEGFPTVISEAMSSGLPIVTTRIRGGADLLVDGTNALFVRERDPGDLAETMERLLGDDGLRSRMAAANVEKVKEFAPSVVAGAYLRILWRVARQEAGE